MPVKKSSKKKKRPMNAYFKKMNAARKAGKKSFTYNGNLYVAAKIRLPNMKRDTIVYRRA